jgi:queuine tRNA-ribosyltransferase
MAFSFQLLAQDGAARRGRLETGHGVVETPVFMPVGTQGAVKAMAPEEVEELGAQILLSNTYHLALRPGADVVAHSGGLHRFMGWRGSILTDSGGFQVYSLADLRSVDDDGVCFRSHVDGSLHRMTPESSIAVQEALGADIAMAFDECTALPGKRSDLERAVARTTAWAKRCLAARRRPDQALFGIVQGGTDRALRARHAEEISSLPFEGLALGGLSVGESIQEMYGSVAEAAPRLPSHKPRYLMGVGLPEDLVTCVGLGIDMFDCVIPTRNARNGQLFTWTDRLVIKNARYREDQRPIEEGCECPTCRRYSRAYLRHLYVAREILAMRLLTAHNLHFYLTLMRRVREAIAGGRFAAFVRDFLASRPPCPSRAARGRGPVEEAG